MSAVATSMSIRRTLARIFQSKMRIYTDGYMQSCKGIDPLSDTFSENVTKAQQLLRTAVVHSLCTPDEMDAITLVEVKKHLSDPTACGYPHPTDPTLGLSAGALYAVIYFSITGLRADANTCLAIDREEINLCDKAVQNAEYAMNARNDTYASKSEAKNEVTAALILIAVIIAVAVVLAAVAQFSS